MLKLGSTVLAVWCVLNALPGIGSLFFLGLGKHAPGLRILFAPAEIPAVEQRALATVDGLAVIANTLIVAVCFLSLQLVWRCLRQGARWAFYGLALSCAMLQIASYVADASYFLGRNLFVIHCSSFVLLTGFALCGKALFGGRGASSI